VRDLDRFEAGDEVTPETLVEKRLIKNTKIDVKLLGSGEIDFALTVRLHGVSSAARAKIEAAGGTVELLRESVVAGARRKTRRAPAVEQPDDGEPAQAEPEPGQESEG